MLTDTEARLTIIDAKDRPEVDVVGDARNPDVYEEANVGTADAIIIDLDDDTTTLFATLIAQDANPQAHIVARANEEENERKIYRAGADYVQSLAVISGCMMAATVLDQEEVLSFRTKIDVVRFPAGRLAGRTLVAEDVRARTGCTVVAAVRDGNVITSLNPETFVFEDDDQLVVVGTDEGGSASRSASSGEDMPPVLRHATTTRFRNRRGARPLTVPDCHAVVMPIVQGDRLHEAPVAGRRPRGKGEDESALSTGRSWSPGPPSRNHYPI